MIKEINEHRSVRSFVKKQIPQEVLDRVLEGATRASTTGNMQLYSIVVTRDEERKKELAKYHFNQPMIENSSMLVTFCADVNRFSLWCEQRNAEPRYDNLLWYLNASIDTLLASQNFSLAAESEGLGICYLGTTLYTAKQICEFLNLPKGVIPITTLAVGYPSQTPPLTDRLPVRAVVHYEKYQDYSPESINDIWQEKESLEDTRRLILENKLENLAQIFTQNRYKAEDNIAISKTYFELLKEQGFMNF